MKQYVNRTMMSRTNHLNNEKKSQNIKTGQRKTSAVCLASQNCPNEIRTDINLVNTRPQASQIGRTLQTTPSARP